MNPNSRNQRWSAWSYHVTPDATRRPDFATVKLNAARFGRLVFGSASAMRVTQRGLSWEIDIRTEGHPVHDPSYVTWMHAQWDRFCRQGFGATCVVQPSARLLAGDRQDGQPADQLILLPSLTRSQEPFDGERPLPEV